MSSYGWRDIGLGPRREEITIVGNFDFQNETKSPADIAKEYCSNCQVKLVYSNIIKKWICPKHGCNLTQEESDILLGKATASTSPAAANVPTTASVDDLPPGVGGGFIPSTQQSSGSSSNNVINRQKEAERTDGGGHTIRIPSSRKSKEEDGKYRTPSGELIELDAEQQSRVDKGYTILEATTTLFDPTGPNTMEVVNPDDIRREKEMNQHYDGRYDKKNDGSGLAV